MHIQYKYVVRNKDGSVVRWQEGANVSLDLPGGNAAELALDVEDSWNKSKQVRSWCGDLCDTHRIGPGCPGLWHVCTVWLRRAPAARLLVCGV